MMLRLPQCAASSSRPPSFSRSSPRGSAPCCIRSPPQVTSGPTFSNEVVRIFQNRCQSCHHPGDIAPFSLMTYADAAPHADAIKYMTQTRQMPPWKPTPACGEFAEARVLGAGRDRHASPNGSTTARRRETSPTFRRRKNFDGGWALGQPDLVLSYSEPYTPPVTGDMYRCFPMPTNAARGHVRLGDRHQARRPRRPCTTSSHTSTQRRRFAEARRGGCRTRLHLVRRPGLLDHESRPRRWAAGRRARGRACCPTTSRCRCRRIRASCCRSTITRTASRPIPDQTEIGIYFAKKKPNKLVRILPLINQTFTIPPNDPNYRVTATPFSAPVPRHLYLIAPHMHLLGRKMHVTADAAGRRREVPDQRRRLGLQLAGSCTATKIRSRFRPHEARARGVLRQLRRQLAQPEQSAEAGVVGRADHRRDVHRLPRLHHRRREPGHGQAVSPIAYSGKCGNDIRRCTLQARQEVVPHGRRTCQSAVTGADRCGKTTLDCPGGLGP